MNCRIHEIEVVLNCWICGRSREEGEKETQALRLYLSTVETAAAGLVSRVQDLESLLALCKSSFLIPMVFPFS